MRSIVFLAALSSSFASTDEAASGCCAFGGNGAAISLGVATMTLPGQSETSTQLPIAFGSSGVTAAPWISMVVAPKTSPEDSLLGWYISQNASAQTLYFWSNTTGEANCHSSSVALPDYFVQGFGQCTGAMRGAMFSSKTGSYNLGNTPAEQWSDLRGSVTASFLPSQGCAPVFLSAINSPLGTGAFAISFQSGGAGAPSWTPPSYCL